MEQPFQRLRGQVHVVGIVLLIGLVAVGSVGILVLGSTVLETHERAIEIEDAEQSMVEFAAIAETTMLDDRESSAVDMGSFEQGHVELEDSGHITVTHSESKDVLHDESLGTLVYRNGDTEIAYQGGGVWRTDGDGTVQLSSSAIDSRSGTMTLPVVRLTGDQFRSTSIDGTVWQSETPTRIEPPRHETADQMYRVGTIEITITSAYCEGWEREFEETMAGTVTERCSEGQPGRVQLQRAVPPRIDDVDSAVIAPDIEFGSNATGSELIAGDVRTGSLDDDDDRVAGTVFDEDYDAPSVDTSVTAMVDQCEEDGFDDLPDTVTDPGRHCVETIEDDHTFDTSAGDIDIVVRDSIGDPNFQGDLDVEGENDVTIYAGDDVTVAGNAEIGTESDPDQLRVLVSGNGTVTTASGTPEFAALLYAPDSTVTLQGNPTLDGSVVADRVEIPNNNVGVVQYDDRIAEIEAVPGPGPYLHHLDATAYELTIDE